MLTDLQPVQFFELWLGADSNLATFAFSIYIVVGNAFGVGAAVYADWSFGAYRMQVDLGWFQGFSVSTFLSWHGLTRTPRALSQ